VIQVAILAGGLGTRLYPITRTIPKAMVEVAGRPFLESQIALLRAGGVEDIVLLVGHMADMISDHFGDGSDFGVRIRYSHEGDTLLDTAGAIRNALPLLDEAFFVTFADSYLLLPYRQIWEEYRASGKEALMVVYRNDGKFDTSDISVEGGLVTAYQKTPPLPGAFYINDGLMAFQRQSVATLPEGTRISLQQFLQPVIARNGLLAWETEQRFYEIGSHAGLKELEGVLSQGVHTI
jgi:NDP-sugar pyrophosphorylase family protein